MSAPVPISTQILAVSCGSFPRLRGGPSVQTIRRPQLAGGRGLSCSRTNRSVPAILYIDGIKREYDLIAYFNQIDLSQNTQSPR